MMKSKKMYYGDYLSMNTYWPNGQVELPTIGCQAPTLVLGDMECIKTSLWNFAIIIYHVHIILHPYTTHEWFGYG